MNIEVMIVKSILLVRNLKDESSAKLVRNALNNTRVVYEISLEKQCVIIEGNADMVAVARKVISDLGFVIL